MSGRARGTKRKAGTYAQYVAVDEAHLAKVPAAVDMATAGGVPLVALTAWQALHVSVAAH
jgi:NADPH:quinone reductase-like Zn-dependent oxidoreductase